ncbi:MAG TPA: hypothetical protein VND64_26575 [Pirellulales bacterium]|nr:hypothetical protein [Pirellulales bacterium]
MRLVALGNKAAGPDDNYCWKMGVGLFQSGAVTSELDLRLDPQNSLHGFIEPSRTMSKWRYDESLADTRNQWEIDEN